jgi:hypothetical protein
MRRKRIRKYGRGGFLFERPETPFYPSLPRSKRQSLRKLRTRLEYAHKSDSTPSIPHVPFSTASSELQSWLPDDLWIIILKLATSVDPEVPFCAMATSKQLHNVVMRDLDQLWPKDFLKNVSVMYSSPNLDIAQRISSKTRNQLRLATLSMFVASLEVSPSNLLNSFYLDIFARPSAKAACSWTAPTANQVRIKQYGRSIKHLQCQTRKYSIKIKVKYSVDALQF